MYSVSEGEDLTDNRSNMASRTSATSNLKEARTDAAASRAASTGRRRTQTSSVTTKPTPSQRRPSDTTPLSLASRRAAALANIAARAEDDVAAATLRAIEAELATADAIEAERRARRAAWRKSTRDAALAAGQAAAAAHDY